MNRQDRICAHDLATFCRSMRLTCLARETGRSLRRGQEPVDGRLGPDADWLFAPHQANLEQTQAR
jgi:hypothetical protein